MADPTFSQEINALLAEVKLGLDAEQFIRTDLGRLLLGRAKFDAEEGVARLKRAKPTDVSEIIEAQMQANIPERFLAWLDQAIMNGRNAETQINQMESNQEES